MEPTVRCVHLQQVLEPETVCGLLILCAFSASSRLPFSSCSGLIRVTMEAMKIEQDGVAISDLEQFMIENVAWETMVQM